MMTIPRIAELTGQDRGLIRRTIAAAPGRLSAPHAQFAHLGSIVIRDGRKSALGVYDRSDFVDA
jgi:hypothetical protein